MRGTAVIASDSGGLRYIVRSGETGLLVAPNEAVALTSAMDWMLGEGRAERCGALAAQDALARFPLSLMITRFESVYQQLLEGVARAPVVNPWKRRTTK